MNLLPTYYRNAAFAETALMAVRHELGFARLLRAGQSLKNSKLKLKPHGKLSPQVLSLFADPGTLFSLKALHAPLMEVVLSTEHRYNAFEQRYALELQCMNPSAFGKPGVMYLRCIEKEFPFLQVLIQHPLWDYRMTRLVGRVAVQFATTSKLQVPYPESISQGNAMGLWQLFYAIWSLGRPLAALLVAHSGRLRELYQVESTEVLMTEAGIWLDGCDANSDPLTYFGRLAADLRGLDWMISQMQPQPLAAYQVNPVDALTFHSLKHKQSDLGWRLMMVQQVQAFASTVSPFCRLETSTEITSRLAKLLDEARAWQPYASSDANSVLLNGIGTLTNHMGVVVDDIEVLEDISCMRQDLAVYASRIAAGQHTSADLDSLAEITGLIKSAEAEHCEIRHSILNRIEDVSALIAGSARFYGSPDTNIPELTMFVVAPAEATQAPDKCQNDTATTSEDKLASLQAELDILNDLLQERDECATRLRQELEDVRSELQTQRVKAECLEVSLKECREGLQSPAPTLDSTALLDVAGNPCCSAVSVLKVVAAMYPEKVEVLPSAYSSAAQQSSFNLGGKMFQMLAKLVEEYLPAYLSGGDNAARGVFGANYSATESDTVKADERMRSMRRFEYRGQNVEFFQHLRVNNKVGQAGMRIHFGVVDSKIVIAYAGEHLEVACTS